MAGAIRDAEIIPEVRRKIEQVGRGRGLLYALIVGMSALLWNTWWGDPLIYLSMSGPFQFNPGEVSFAVTSPVWHLITLLAFGSPFVFKAIALWATLIAAFHIMESAGTLAGYLAFPLYAWGLMGYETSLALACVAMLWRSDRPAYWLAFIRPDGLLLAVVVLLWRKKFWPAVAAVGLYAAYAGLAQVFGGLHSVESRLAFGEWSWRYAAVFSLWGIMWAYAWTALRVPLLYVAILAGAFIGREASWAYRESNRGYDFDTISLKPQAEYLNTLEGGALESYEVQIRYWLNDNWRVVSPQGLVGYGRATHVLDCDRWADLSAEPLATWSIDKPGFLNWVSVGKR